MAISQALESLVFLSDIRTSHEPERKHLPAACRSLLAIYRSCLRFNQLLFSGWFGAASWRDEAEAKLIEVA
jgi:hypothetical protein